MKSHLGIYVQFVKWVQADMKKDWALVNRKVFSVVLWCLILPAFLTVILYGLRRFQVIAPLRYTDSILFLPPFVFALYSLWPTLRDLPRAFKKGGMGNVLDESAREVEWREKTAQKMSMDLNLTSQEWEAVSFHLEHDLERLNYQNRYLTLLSAVVLFLLFQFLDLGGGSDVIIPEGPAALMKVWVDQFSQWTLQALSLILFSTLFYLSGLQMQRFLRRYWICILAIQRHEKD